MADLHGRPARSAALAISEEINHLKGDKVDVIINPKGSVRLLYLECEEGEFRIRSGEILPINMPDNAIPEAEVTDGSGSLSLREGQSRVFPAPAMVTVRGLSNKSVLTYYFV
ncbi:MAG: hypothetical protein V3R87_02080 [Dehalococcoidia bacterium]